ncbi:MAG: hypothetical protein IJU82_09685 [Ruminiclostridium sp.]|nr:hypothetical protein [Ruminiclostridium sp.]
MYVWLLQHSYPLENGADEVKMLGVYSTEALAFAAVSRYRKLPGFCDHPDDFYIDRYEVDKDCWTEGFIPSEEA